MPTTIANTTNDNVIAVLNSTTLINSVTNKLIKLIAINLYIFNTLYDIVQ